jgi:hypothetical protein
VDTVVVTLDRFFVETLEMVTARIRAITTHGDNLVGVVLLEE